MKVWIGPYSKWWNTTRFEDWACSKVFGVQYSWELSDQQRESFKGRLIDKITDAMQWVINHTFNPLFRLYGRREIVHIDHYDIWNMDNTLAMIILPMLERLHGDKHGIPGVYVEDIPSFLLKQAYSENDDCAVGDNKYPNILFSETAWAHILKEIIFSFKQKTMEWSSDECMESGMYDMYISGTISKTTWLELNKLHGERIQRGYVLFGKYFQNMWT